MKNEFAIEPVDFEPGRGIEADAFGEAIHPELRLGERMLKGRGVADRLVKILIFCVPEALAALTNEDDEPLRIHGQVFAKGRAVTGFEEGYRKILHAGRFGTIAKVRPDLFPQEIRQAAPRDEAQRVIRVLGEILQKRFQNRIEATLAPGADRKHSKTDHRFGVIVAKHRFELL
jgi:hypothetical protein